jgi:hypothetical protein
MTSKQKAWRIEAAKVNARRAAGSNEPSARVQKTDSIKMLPAPSFLFFGLMMRAGLYDPMPVTPSTPPITVQGSKSWLANAWAKAKRWFN